MQFDLILFLKTLLIILIGKNCCFNNISGSDDNMSGVAPSDEATEILLPFSSLFSSMTTILLCLFLFMFLATADSCFQ